MDFYESVKLALLQKDPREKIIQVRAIDARLEEAKFKFESGKKVESIENPGRPDSPELVHPSQVMPRKLNTRQGRIALIHAICHIEFNAINLALDAVYRFRNLPLRFYQDWMRVAVEESRHFTLLCERLANFNCRYGDFNAHNGLWEMAVKTRHSLLERMALVPRVLEARGLDVTPGMIKRLDAQGDQKTSEILKLILREEVGHVEIGTKWFRYACAQQGVESDIMFISLLRKYNVSTGKGPLHLIARKQAGFNLQELQALSGANSPT